MKKELKEDEEENKQADETAVPVKKRSKYLATKKTVTLPDGTEHTFDSTKEAKVYNQLAERIKAGEISNLRMQVPYMLIPKQKRSNGKAERSIKYLADFVYTEGDTEKVIDVKGYRRGGAYAVFAIKRKLMLWVHGIEVEEV